MAACKAQPRATDSSAFMVVESSFGESAKRLGERLASQVDVFIDVFDVLYVFFAF